MIMIFKFILNFCNFSTIICFFLTRLLTLGILFSILVNAVYVAKLLISGIVPSISVIYIIICLTRCLGVVVITAAQLHSTKPELRFCAGSNPARGVSEIRDGEDL